MCRLTCVVCVCIHDHHNRTGLGVGVVGSSFTGNLHPTPCIGWLQGTRGDPGCMAKARVCMCALVTIPSLSYCLCDCACITRSLIYTHSMLSVTIPRPEYSSRRALLCSHTPRTGSRTWRWIIDGSGSLSVSTSMSPYPPMLQASVASASISISRTRRMWPPIYAHSLHA